MAVQTGYPHIVLDERGRPVIEGTTLKVVELVVEKLAYGWSPEELQLQHPYLTPGQIHAALAYYWDHAGELDREIADRIERTERLRRAVKTAPSPLVTRLKTQGLL